MKSDSDEGMKTSLADFVKKTLYSVHATAISKGISFKILIFNWEDFYAPDNDPTAFDEASKDDFFPIDFIGNRQSIFIGIEVYNEISNEINV